jgi:hypothetical protein
MADACGAPPVAKGGAARRVDRPDRSKQGQLGMCHSDACRWYSGPVVWLLLLYSTQPFVVVAAVVFNAALRLVIDDNAHGFDPVECNQEPNLYFPRPTSHCG